MLHKKHLLRSGGVGCSLVVEMYVVCAQMEKVTKGKKHKDMFCGCFVFFFL